VMRSPKHFTLSHKKENFRVSERRAPHKKQSRGFGGASINSSADSIKFYCQSSSCDFPVHLPERFCQTSQYCRWPNLCFGGGALAFEEINPLFIC
jgi:hypothetical protein